MNAQGLSNAGFSLRFSLLPTAKHIPNKHNNGELSSEYNDKVFDK